MKLPYLPFDKWEKTRITLHLIFQIIGKIRLKATPRKNHWWYVTLYVSTKGFSTHPIPLPDGINTFEIIINVHKNAVQLQSSTGEEKEIPLRDGYTVSEFYRDILEILKEWGLHPKFINKPLDMGIDKSFDELTAYHHYDRDSIRQFWQMMLWNDGVLKEFSGRFYGKTCPVQIYWHHLDIAVTRFSGKYAPPMDPKTRLLEKDSYSHEVISFGFWAGDDNIPEPAYYAYTAPSPPHLDKEPLQPEQAFWTDANGSPMAILKYKELLKKADPRKTLLDFLESAYQAGAKLANWDMEALRVPALNDL
ncbi:MAG: hypothetical protein GXO86_14505 [Chlorobi bacterium]|nr:hypothetical protein [Chlorobiota bacterium]